MSIDSLRATPTQQKVIVAHYECAVSPIVHTFANTPLEVAYYIDGLEKEPTYSDPGAHKPLPKTIPSAVIKTSHSERTYPLVAANTILWLAHRGAVGFLSWTPSPLDPESVGFARIILRPVHGADQSHLKFAMLALKTALFSHGLEAIPVLGGVDDAALFIPFSDAPQYDAVRAWLHGLVDHAIELHPKLLIHEKRPGEKHTAARIACTVVSNAVGRFSALPYSLAGTPDLPMVTPFDWTELGTLENGDVTAANSAERLAKGDVFGDLAKYHANQRFADAAR